MALFRLLALVFFAIVDLGLILSGVGVVLFVSRLSGSFVFVSLTSATVVPVFFISGMLSMSSRVLLFGFSWAGFFGSSELERINF